MRVTLDEYISQTGNDPKSLNAVQRRAFEKDWNAGGQRCCVSALEHTPAPWRVWKDMDPKEPRQIVGPSDDFVCVIDEINTNNDANARLIAAAPELLRALQALEGYTDVFTEHYGRTSRGAEVLAQAKAAIAKAVGK
jgi:hypothetical protein